MNIKIRDISYAVDGGKHSIYWDLINSDQWENETFDVIDHYLKPGSVALDIGAWAGPISFYMANKCEKVYALEPDPAIYKALKTNCKLNPQLGVRPIQIAISDKSSTETLHARKAYGNSSSSLLYRSNDNLNSKTVKTLKIQDFVESIDLTTIDFIKIDTEGGEFIFLKHWHEFLRNFNYPTLLISFHLGQLKENIFLQRFQNKIIARAVFKLCKKLNINLFNSTINQEVSELLNALSNYKYAYKSNGQSVNFNGSNEQVKLIGNNSFVFSNRIWNE